MTQLHVLRVFVGADGRHGNPLGVFLDGLAVHLRDRQKVARELNFSETVFVDDVADGAARRLGAGWRWKQFGRFGR